MGITNIEYKRAKTIVREIERRYNRHIDEVVKELEVRPLNLQEVDDLIEGDAARLTIELYGRQKTSKHRGKIIGPHKKEGS